MNPLEPDVVIVELDLSVNPFILIHTQHNPNRTLNRYYNWDLMVINDRPLPRFSETNNHHADWSTHLPSSGYVTYMRGMSYYEV